MVKKVSQKNTSENQPILSGDEIAFHKTIAQDSNPQMNHPSIQDMKIGIQGIVTENKNNEDSSSEDFR